MKQGVSPAVAVIVIIVVVVVVALVGWQVFAKKGHGKGDSIGPKTPQEMESLMKQKGMSGSPPVPQKSSPGAGTGSGGMGSMGGGPPGGVAGGPGASAPGGATPAPPTPPAGGEKEPAGGG